MSERIDVLARLKTTEDMFAALTGEPLTSLPIREVRAAVAELIEAAAVTLNEPWEIERLRVALARVQGDAA